MLFIRCTAGKKFEVSNTGKMHILKPIECMVLNTGIALFSFKFLEMFGMYLFLIEILATYTALLNRNKFRNNS